MKSTLFRIALGAMFCFPSISVHAQKLFTKTYSAADGLPHNRILSIHQDHRGYMWFGTPGGITRFDGWAFETYSVDKGLSNNVVNAIYETRDLELWAATDEGFCRYDAAADSFISYQDSSGISKGIVRAILEDDLGNLWFATATGLTVRHQRTRRFATFTQRDGLPSSAVYALARGPSKRIYAGTAEGIAEISLANENLTVVVYTTRDGLINNRIECLYADSRSVLWVGTSVGLSRLEDGRFYNYTASSGLPGNTVTSITENKSGQLWLTTTAGISRFRADGAKIQATNYHARNGLGTNQISCALEDREHSMWFGTFTNGVIKLVSEDIQIFTDKDGLPGESVHSISKDPHGWVWIGTSDGLAVLKSDRLESFQTRDGLISSNVWDVAIDRFGILWVGTYLGFQILIPRSYFTLYPEMSQSSRVHRLISSSRPHAAFYSVDLAFMESFSGRFIPDVLVDRHQQIWVVCMDKGVGRITFDPGGGVSFRLYTKLDGLLNHNGWCLLEDRHGRIWVGSIGGGLSYYDQSSDRFVTFSKSDGLPDNSIISLAEDLQGNLWMGSQNGLSKLRSDAVNLSNERPTDLRAFLTTFSTRHGLSDNTVNAIAVDSLGFVWAGTNKGLNYFDPLTGTVLKIYRRRHGLSDNEVGGHNAMLIDRHHRIWVGTRSGISRLPSETMPTSIPGPISYLKSFVVENKTERTSRRVRTRPVATGRPQRDSLYLDQQLVSAHPILYQENTLLLEFVSPSFRDESDVTFSYRLLGFENEWSKPTSENKVRYTNLDAGDYTFQVRSCNGLGVWSVSNLTVHFSIESPFWQSWWFTLFVVTFISLSTYTVYQFRISLVQKRTAELENKVLSRTRELVKQKETIERVLAELKETQLHLVHSEKMASLGQLVAGIAHEINNPITYVKANISILEKKATSIDKMFNKFSEVFDFHEQFKSMKDPAHQAFSSKLEEIDQLITTMRFEEFLSELPMVIHEMRDGVERTQKIVEDLRNFSRLDESQYKEILITDCIDSTLNILKNEFKSRVRVHRNYGPVPPIYCNPGHINQVMMNLLSNAFHAIENDGDVWIKTSSGSNNILISIRDNGRGIPFEIQHKVFDPFFTTKAVGKGTGLGLSISYKIIENHKGTIFFESEPGKGTEFKITLPIRRSHEEHKTD